MARRTERTMRAPKYTNPKLPEGISSGHEHPLAEFAKSSLLIIALLAVVVVGAYLAARLVAPYMPFAWESALAQQLALPDIAAEPAASPTQRYLADLGARVAAASDLPADMSVTIHYVEADIVNAFATLGGHIFVFEGLWKLLDSENAAAMLLGHEIAHVKNRDPIRSASGALLASLAVGIVLNNVDMVGMGSLLTAMHFSRQQETRADSDAARAVVGLFGHLNGATDLFDRIEAAAKDASQPPAFLASHPGLAVRIANLQRQAGRNGWTFQGDKTPLP
jgi:predicted Zn-dependent protease